MIPYVLVRDVHVGPLTIHPFGLLVATAVMVGTALATRRARTRGYDLHKLNSFITWMLVAGFIGGHVLDQIFYYPEQVLREPLRLLKLWESLSSFGGFTGALVGILLWQRFEAKPGLKLGPIELPKFSRRKEKQPILPFADLIVSVFPVAWIFGRSGCSVAHDHLGAFAKASDALAIAYDPSATAGPELIKLVYGPVPRFDLGLLEMLFTVVLAGLLALTWSRHLRLGTYIVVTSLAYAPVRFAMDFLRDTHGPHADARYAMLTPAQWECMALLALGLGMWRFIARMPDGGRALERSVTIGSSHDAA